MNPKENDLKNEDKPKCKDNIKNKDYPKNEDNLKRKQNKV